MKLTWLPKVISCRNSLRSEVSLRVTGPGINPPVTSPSVRIVLASPKVPSVRKSLTVAELDAESKLIKLKVRYASVPDKDEVSRVNCSAVALAISGAVRRIAARTERQGSVLFLLHSGGGVKPLQTPHINSGCRNFKQKSFLIYNLLKFNKLKITSLRGVKFSDNTLNHLINTFVFILEQLSGFYLIACILKSRFF